MAITVDAMTEGADPRADREPELRWLTMRVALVTAGAGAGACWIANWLLVGVASLGGGGHRFEALPMFVGAAVGWVAICMAAAAVFRALDVAAMVLWIPWLGAVVAAFYAEPWLGLPTEVASPALGVVATLLAAGPGVSWLRGRAAVDAFRDGLTKK